MLEIFSCCRRHCCRGVHHAETSSCAAAFSLGIGKIYARALPKAPAGLGANFQGLPRARRGACEHCAVHGCAGVPEFGHLLLKRLSELVRTRSRYKLAGQQSVLTLYNKHNLPAMRAHPSISPALPRCGARAFSGLLSFTVSETEDVLPCHFQCI